MGVYKRKGKWEVRSQMKGVKYYRQVPEAHNKGQAPVAEASLRTEIYEGRYGKEGGEIGTTDFKERTSSRPRKSFTGLSPRARDRMFF